MGKTKTGPSFICIGAQKAGTTWLYQMMLHKYAGVSFPGGKEVHFWNQNYDKGIEWYQNLFPAGGVTGDITPAYSILPKDPPDSRLQPSRSQLSSLYATPLIEHGLQRA